MNKIDRIFDMLDKWRRLPSYQLERRADLFFALYLPQALEEKLGFPVRTQLIPEFPVRKGTIHPQTDNNNKNRSFKIDYLGLSEKRDKAIFVELKTDMSSLNIEQCEYLDKAKEFGLEILLDGVLEIFQTRKDRNSRQKYFYLVKQLAALGLFRIPNDDLEKIMSRHNQRGFKEASLAVENIAVASESLIVFVQPRNSESNIRSCEESQGSEYVTISFDELRDVVLRDVHSVGDELSARFATSLSKWKQDPFFVQDPASLIPKT